LPGDERGIFFAAFAGDIPILLVAALPRWVLRAVDELIF
jgi:hypothetical protein